MIPIDAIVLAAGRSSRMGSPKARLEIEPGVTFLEHAVKLLRHAGCRYVVAVVSADDDWTARLADVAGAAVVLNEMPNSQQVDSIRLGIANLPEDSEAVLVLPVDVPRVQQSTIESLIKGFVESRAPVVLPVHNGEGGHPVLFARSIFGELMTDDLPQGAETIVDLHKVDRLEITVDDPGVLVDVDSPADFARIKGE